ncbi:DUF6685 family protein [Metapseudomonas resinovorans]|uniref:Uncharacterized protein n=1 Tax=Metapseudomonas resinovorans NBRC 106553 TaxID=1245471 RepID=S6AHM9_METRE|nr:DUF6685 family protein [Pseudomonas resinovorans]BAN47795.1 hypothetical protein PCA10_20630 [Pseudomonas resinovorans NBRC 106553]
MSQMQPPPPPLSARLAAFAQRLGLGKAPRRIFERASQLRLPFQQLPKTEASIWWQAGPPLQRLVELPRGALSGPVQEDKAEAHAVLIGVVKRSEQRLSSFDLRQVDGLCGNDHEPPPSPSFEDYLAGLHSRKVRIISYKDFIKAISLPLPRFLAGAPISLYRADWHGKRVFWSGDQHVEAFAASIAYARLRELEATLPAEVTDYRLDVAGLERLDDRYHMLAMPVQAWSDPAFMGLLLDGGIPYSRLTFLRNSGAPEFILLPKKHADATALGEGLRLAGAADVVTYLQTLA